MRGKVVLASVVVIVAAIFLFRKMNRSLPVDDSRIEKAFDEPVLAVYDRAPDIRNGVSDSWHHMSILLGKSPAADFFEKLTRALNGKGNTLLTIKLLGESDWRLLQEVNDGGFDDVFNRLFETLGKYPSPVFVRLNPEMEVPVKTYPWQYQSSSAYVEAFRHFVQLSKSSGSAIRIVWGPAGYPGTEEYYPGDEFTDATSITLGSAAEKQLDAYPPYPDIQTEVRRKLHRLRFMDKPVFILGQRNMQADASVAKAIATGLNQLRAEAAVIYPTARLKIEAAIEERKNSPIVGVYDPRLLLAGSASVTAEHIFIDLTHVQNGSFEKEFNAVVGRKHFPIVSFEPWRDQKVRKDTNVLANTVNGVYDEEFRELYRIMKASGQTVYLRFAHEMEIPIHRYAWQSQDPVLYIRAFRYFMEFGERDEKIRRVWGPAGDRGSLEWWPGGDVVDYVSVAVYGLPDKNITDPHMQESFSTIYDRKLHRVKLAGKPVFVTEFGVKGPEEYKRQWIGDAARLIKKHKEIAGISYFNLADNPEVWGDIPAPDWSIKLETFEKFTDELAD